MTGWSGWNCTPEKGKVSRLSCLRESWTMTRWRGWNWTPEQGKVSRLSCLRESWTMTIGRVGGTELLSKKKYRGRVAKECWTMTRWCWRNWTPEQEKVSRQSCLRELGYDQVKWVELNSWTRISIVADLLKRAELWLGGMGGSKLLNKEKYRGWVA